MSKIISAQDVHCDVCKAVPGKPCTFMYGHGSRRERRFRFGAHAQRVRDADAATQALKVLTS